VISLQDYLGSSSGIAGCTVLNKTTHSSRFVDSILRFFIQDGFYTEIARGSNSMAYYWYGLDHMSRFDDASVKSFFSVERLFSPAGGGFFFDTNALHRVRVDGQRQRDAVVVEIANVHKLREIPMTSCGSQGLDVGRGFGFPHRYHRRPGF
jgi:hypothetical protein